MTCLCTGLTDDLKAPKNSSGKPLPGWDCKFKVARLFTNYVYIKIQSRAVPNIRFVFASGPNSGPNNYSVFGRILAVGPNTNSGQVTPTSALFILSLKV